MEKKNKCNLVIINQSGNYMDSDVANEALKYYDQVVRMGICKKTERPCHKQVRYDKLIPFDKKSTIRRLWSWGFGSIQVFWKLLTRYRKWDILYYTNPPMACWSSLVLGNKFSIMEYDIYPDALVTIGIGRNNLISRFWRWANCKLFSKAERIFTLSDGMKECLAQYGHEEKIKVIPVWASSTNFHQIGKNDNILLKQLGLQDKFIVLYSGNIGYTHSVEVIIEIAKTMKNVDDVHFLIIGEGKKKTDIENEVKRTGLTNVSLLPYQPIDILPYSLSSADLGVITLEENVAKVSVPSKTFNLLAVGAPLLAIANDQTEVYRLLSKYECGRCIPKDNIELMVEYIMKLKQDKDYEKLLSHNSIMASMDFTYENAKQYFNE